MDPGQGRRISLGVFHGCGVRRENNVPLEEKVCFCMPFRTEVFVERQFVRIRMPGSVSASIQNNNINILRANLIDPVIDQSYQSQHSVQSQ